MQANATSRWEHGRASTCCEAPGTCGELVQGAIDGRDFLVNCPIGLFSRATVFASARAGLHVADPQAFSKIADAASLVSRRIGLRLRHEIRIDSQIPRGKGMASSTADITAALDALCRHCAVRLSDTTVAKLLAAVEPSDCVHFPGIAHVNHLTGRLIESLPAPAGLRVLIVDCGGQIDTVDFDRERARDVYRRNQPTIVAALALLRRGLQGGNMAAVAEAASRSARLSQQILYKPQFEQLLTETRELGAWGVNCAHSGTVLGVLHRADEALTHALVRRIEASFGPDLRIHGDFEVIGGGCHACN